MNPINWIEIIMLFGTFQGGILIIALLRKNPGQNPSNRILTAFVGSVSLLLAFVALGGMGILSTAPRLGYLGDSVSLLYGPLFYFYLLRLLTPSKRKMHWHLAPFLLFVVVNTLVFSLSPESALEGFHSTFYIVMSSGSLLQVLVYLIFSWKLVRQYQQIAQSQLSFDAAVAYIRVLIGLTSLCVLVFTINYVSQLLSLTMPFAFMSYELGWLLLACITFVLAYYTISQPEIFRLNIKPLSQNQVVPDAEIGQLVKKLEDCLTAKRPYLDPELTLEELAKLVGSRKELLSKAINQGMGVNFYRLINDYRIKAFEELAKDPKNNHLTHLALALESGFRSKTTFYQAFKTLKQTTPSAYLKSL